MQIPVAEQLAIDAYLSQRYQAEAAPPEAPHIAQLSERQPLFEHVAASLAWQLAGQDVSESAAGRAALDCAGARVRLASTLSACCNAACVFAVLAQASAFEPSLTSPGADLVLFAF